MGKQSWNFVGLLAFAAVCGSYLASPTAAIERAVARQALASITIEELENHVNVLADDTFEGREAGSRGGRAAAGYLISELTKNGVQPAGVDGGFFQPFGNGYRNILGLIRGSDPKLRDEVVVIGAHYDHVGYGTRRNSYGPTGYIHNGADDNASGTAGLLEVIEALASLPEPPARTILFAFWDGEEKGLLGSKHWIAHPTMPIRKISVVINVDMIGRLRDQRVEVFGTRTSWGLRQFVSRSNQSTNLELDFTWEIKANSDHYPFFARDIPILMFHTGLHDDYHRPSDDSHKINVPGIRHVGELLFNTALDLAERDDRFQFRSKSERETPKLKKQSEQAVEKARPRLGVTWRVVEEPSYGLKILSVTARSAAAKAGLKVGDELIAFAGKPIVDRLQLRLDLLSAERDVTFGVRRGGNNELVEVPVTLDGSRTRVGIAWREDEAEPGSFMLTRVVTGSAADQAGLRVGDRIYEFAGKAAKDSDQLVDWATTLPGPFQLLVERSGRLREVTVNVPSVE